MLGVLVFYLGVAGFSQRGLSVVLGFGLGVPDDLILPRVR